MRIGLLGPYASRNLGDTAIQMTVIKNLKARRPGVEIVGICPEPEDTVDALGVPAFPLDGHGPAAVPSVRGELSQTKTVHGRKRTQNRWPALKRIALFVRSLALVIVSGGGQLDDFWGGAWAHPFAMFTWSLLARLQGTRVAFLGVGLDRLSNPLSRFFALSALRLANYRSFRDAGTRTALEDLGLRAPSHLCPDLAFSLLSHAADDPLSASPPFVVVNPISKSTWTHGSDARHEAYIRSLASACDWIVERGLRVRIVCSQHAMDRPVALRLSEAIRPQFSGKVELREVVRVTEFLAQVSGARLVVASRLHGAILSLVMGAPVVAISPQRKVAQLMEDVGLADYRVELQNFAPADLIDRIRAALDEGPHLRQRVRERTQVFSAALSKTYDDVLSLV